MQEVNKSFFSKKVALFLLLILVILQVSLGFLNLNGISKYLELIISFFVVFSIVVVFFFSDLKSTIINYLKESYQEAIKVVWPAKDEVIKITITVFIFVALMSLFLWLIDSALGWLVYSVFLGWR